MNTQRSPSPGIPATLPDPRQGFALVVALSLMGFILLLSLALVTLLQLEIQQSSGSLSRETARQNALLGLRMALTQLQLEAGPDQRVTARAEILGVDTDRSMWTGVWASDSASGPVWLVSWPDGSSPDPSPDTPWPSPPVTLVRDAGPGVAAATVTVNDTSGRAVGHYAYWTGDEGVKASLRAGVDRASSASDAVAYRQRLKTPAANGIGQVEALAYWQEMDADQREEVAAKVAELSQLDIAGPSELDSRLAHFHDLALESRGVLTNVRQGGLRFDLTRPLDAGQVNFPGPYGHGWHIFSGGPRWNILTDYYARRVDPDSPVATVEPRRQHTGNFRVGPTPQWPASHGLNPIIVASELAFGMVPANTENTLGQLTIAPVIALANPYNVALETATYVVRYYSFNGGLDQLTPQFRLSFTTVDDAGDTETHELRQTVWDTVNWGPGWDTYEADYPTQTRNMHINPLLPDYEDNPPPSQNWRNNDLRFEIETSFQPGEIKYFTLADTVEYTTTPYVRLSEGGSTTAHHAIVPSHAGQDPQLQVLDASGVPQQITGVKMTVGRGQYTTIHLYRKNEAPLNEFVTHPSLDGFNLMQRLHPHFDADTSFPEVPFSSNSNRLLYLHSYLKGSEHDDSQLRRSAVKGISQFNIRAADHHYVWYAPGFHYRAPPLYAAAYRNAPGFDPFDMWEAGARAGGLDGDYSLSLFHVMREGETFFSLGELQNVDFSQDCYAQTYQVGNSIPNPFIPAESVVGEATVTVEGSSPVDLRWIDLSWHLNDALWDGYFFSSLRSDGALTAADLVRGPANPRIDFVSTDFAGDMLAILNDPRRAASALMVEGAFNVNSTSVNAWMAVLAGLSGWRLTDSAGNPIPDRGLEARIPVLRNLYPLGGAGDFWDGYFELEGHDPDGSGAWQDSGLYRLAEALVDEIKRRGPFLTLADFVNRSTDIGPDGDIENALRGAIQAAIDRSGINTSGTPGQQFDGLGAVEDRFNFTFPESVARIDALAQDGFRGAGAPGYLMQADILAMIGSFINVRSDTFLIRAYGDVANPLDPNAPPLARAWCEARVQRLPGFFDPAENAAYDTPAQLRGLNRDYGRRFVITSFRWLDEHEL